MSKGKKPDPLRWVVVVCPRCNGEGAVSNGGDGRYESPWDTCPLCYGSKTLTAVYVKEADAK